MIDPLKTYALIVGVDDYDLPDASKLEEARKYALEFALYLREQKVPDQNVCILTATPKPKDLPVPLQGCKWDYPTTDMLRKRLGDWFGGKQGDLLLVYWIGHGELIDGEDQLLLSNTSDNMRCAIYVRDLKKALASRVLCGYAQKFLIVDSCRAPGKRWNPPETFHLPDWVKPSATLIQSARQGDPTGANEFSPKYIQALRDAEWPPDFEGIARSLNAEIERGEAALATAPPHQPKAPLSAKDLNTVVRALSATPEFGSVQTRQPFIRAVLGDYPGFDDIKKIFGSIAWDFGPSVVADQLVQHLKGREADVGIPALRVLVEAILVNSDHREALADLLQRL